MMKRRSVRRLFRIGWIGCVAAAWGIGVVRADGDASMHAGLDALYVRHQPAEAAEDFRGVLAGNPNHYGATFQLARALDESGQPAEARPVWSRMLSLAESMRDAETAKIVRERLAKPDTVGQDALMRRGLDALYRLHNPAAASERFLEVLRLNPGHYGALYQLASALDWSGRRAEARPYWQKVLTEAKSFRDQDTALAVGDRLKAKP